MTGEQLMRWMDESELVVYQVADHIGLDADAVFDACFSPNSVSVEFETALREAFPDDLDLMRLLSACPHCWDGLAGDDPEYNEPKYCTHCAQGLRLELGRLATKISALRQVRTYLSSMPGADWLNNYLGILSDDIGSYEVIRVFAYYALARLEAA